MIKTSFDQSTASVAKTTGSTIPKRQLEEVAARAAVDFDVFYRERGTAAEREAATSSKIHPPYEETCK